MLFHKCRFLCGLLSLVMLFSLVSCASSEPVSSDDPNETVTPVSTSAVLPEQEEAPQLPEFMNPLTGLACDPSLVGKRPLAVMTNNIKPSLPQSGLGQCDIIYEVLAEGGILRLEGLILDYQNVDVIGTVRSARPYYLEIALAYDALYAHCGGSPQAYSNITRLGINNIDGMVYTGQTYNGAKVFWRDQNRLNSGVSAEHTLFASGKGIYGVATSRNYRMDLNDPDFTAFSFDPAFTSLSGAESAKEIKIPHSYYSLSEFKYNPDTKLYYHSQYGAAHIDGVTGNQVTVPNVFLIFADLGQIQGDTSGRLWVDLVGEGEGYYCNGGQRIPITWKRDSETSNFSYYRADGTELKVQPGKSYISVVDTDTKSDVTFS